jgi:general secretion pathway protein D
VLARGPQYTATMKRWLVFLVLLAPAVARAQPDVTPVSASPAPNEEEAQLYHCKNKGGQVSVTFKPETELKDLVTWVMGFTCRDFLYDPSFAQRGKKITIIAPNTMSAPEAYRVFTVALSTIGLTVVQSGNIYRIVEAPTARTESVPLIHGNPGDSEQIVRMVLRPSYVQVATVQTAVNAMKSTAGDVQIIGSVLLITDYASHVRDMLAIVKQIDVPGGADGIFLIPVIHADADKLVKEVDSIIAMTAAPADKTQPAAVQPKLMVDARTNTIIVAGSQATYDRVNNLVQKIDIAVETESGGSMHIYPLKSAIAEEVAKVINDAITGQTKPNPVTAGKPGAAADSSQPMRLEGDAKVIADKGTNKLIVMSSGRDFIALKNIISELDEPRKQIYIEATILEVVLENDLDFGVSEHATASLGNPNNPNSQSVVIGGVQTGGGSTSVPLSSTNPASLAGLTGLVGGWLGPALAASSLLGTSFPSYGLVFQALGTHSNARILSAPSIIALDNEDAKYQVGTNIPYTKGTIPVSAVNPTAVTTTNIDRKDLLLELDIKPHISNGNEVLLEVKHTNNDLVSDSSTMGPTWSTRTIETRVVVKDQQTVVIGGLMQDKDTTDITSVPILGDIPVIGQLFRYTKKRKIKTNLLVMLTPYIIRDSLDLEQIRAKRTREQDEFLSSRRALDGMKLDRAVDYAKKRGVIEEINRSVEDVEEDAAARAQLVRAPTVTPGPVTPSPADH